MKAVAQHDNNQAVRENQLTERRYFAPDVNIYETKDAYVLEAEMPGVAKDGLEITLEGNALTLVGHRSDESPTGQALYRESRPADYRRVFELDPVIDANKINARVDQGVLTLSLPKAERVKPRKIAVTE
jgi:HSP20 family protein